MRQLIFLAFFGSVITFGAPPRKPNCRLTAARTFKDGRETTMYKDVFTKTKEECQKLSAKGDFTETIRADSLVVKQPDDFNCQVSIWREHRGGASEIIEYQVRVNNELECKKRKFERNLTSEMKTELEEKKRQK